MIRYIGFAKPGGIGDLQKTRLEEVKDVTGGSDDENSDLVVSPSKLRRTVSDLLDAVDKGDLTVEFPTQRYIEDNASGVVKIVDDGSKVVKSYGGTRELRGAKPDMTNVLSVILMPAMRNMVADIKRYRDAYANVMAAKETESAGLRATIAQKDGEIRDKVTAMSELEGRKAQSETDLRGQLSNAEAALQAEKKEKETTVAALTAERNDWRKQAEQKGSEVQVLKQKKREVETDTSPDGKVLTADAGQSMVVIDIGKANNNLMAGMNFEVYAVGKGGHEIPKGSIKVTKTDAGTSTAAVTELFDAYNPIAQGDMIRSLIYNPREVTHVAMVGRFLKMGKSDAARRLEALGVVVDDKVGVHTTYLVVGSAESESQPIEESPEYKSATLYGIPMLSEKELSRLTMY